MISGSGQFHPDWLGMLSYAICVFAELSWWSSIMQLSNQSLVQWIHRSGLGNCSVLKMFHGDVSMNRVASDHLSCTSWLWRISLLGYPNCCMFTPAVMPLRVILCLYLQCQKNAYANVWQGLPSMPSTGPVPWVPRFLATETTASPFFSGECTAVACPQHSTGAALIHMLRIGRWLGSWHQLNTCGYTYLFIYLFIYVKKTRMHRWFIIHHDFLHHTMSKPIENITDTDRNRNISQW